MTSTKFENVNCQTINFDLKLVFAKTKKLNKKDVFLISSPGFCEPPPQKPLNVATHPTGNPV